MNRWGLIAMIVGLSASGCGAPEEDEDFDFVVGDEPAEDGKADGVSGKYSGSPLQFDHGPSASWAELFARVPNYRTVSRALGAQWLVPGVDGKTKYDLVNEARAAIADKPLPPIAKYTLTSDKFRYEMGPIFYRGRMDGSARVLVVGQDAATDEALVHRAFIGGTGQKVQHFLNSVGITHSYFCSNTFLYSIFEQYDEFTDELAMGGPIKDFRNEVFGKVMAENKIELIVSFGSAAHDSVRKFRDEKLGGKFPPNVEWVQMMHPGAAAVGLPKPGSLDPVDDTMVKAVAASFSKGYKRIWDRKARQPGWLKADSDGVTYRRATYYYTNDDVPFRDLPFGASPEVGRGGTKSERGNDGLQVQFRSAKGARYMAPATPPPVTPDQKYSGVTLGDGELTWEPPKVNPSLRHDPGPSAVWAERFAKTPKVPMIEQESGVLLADDFQHPVWYRGHIEGSAKVLVLMHDSSTDQQVAGRAAVGDAGQKLSHLLANVGVGRDYVILNPFPYGVANVAAEQVEKLATSPSLSAFRNDLVQKIIEEKGITTVITLGHVAEASFAPLKFNGTWIKLAHPLDSDATVSWNAALPQLKSLFGGAAATYRATSFKNLRAYVPREDLPWGKPMWFASSGDLSMHPHESWIFWNAPRWMNREPVSR